VEGSGEVCLEVLDWCVLEELRKTINNSSHDRRCPGRDSNRGLPNKEHEFWRLRGFVSRGNTVLVFTTSRHRTSTTHNAMLNIYKSSSALKINLKTFYKCSNGTRYSHSTYSLVLRTADVNTGVVLFVMQRFSDWCIWQMEAQLCVHKWTGGCRFRDSYRDLFETLKILPLQLQIFFVANNRSKFRMNSNIYNINTKEKFYLYQHSSSVSPYNNSTLVA